MEAQNNTKRSAPEPSEKRAYSKPVLIEYGDVREFTRGSGGSQPDVHGTHSG
jgi:hypothetical protein